MTVVNGIWYDNRIGKIKDYDGIGSDHIHIFGMGKNSEGIDIVKCKKCKESRMFIMLMQEDRRNE